MDRSRHTVSELLTDEKTLGAMNRKMLKRLVYITDHWSAVQLVKSEIDHKEPMIVGFFLECAKLTMLEFFQNFFDKYCDVAKSEELEVATDSLFLILTEQYLYHCIRSTLEKECTSLQSRDCTDDFSANATTFPSY